MRTKIHFETENSNTTTLINRQYYQIHGKISLNILLTN